MSCPLKRLAELTGYSCQHPLEWEQLQESPLFQYFLEAAEPEVDAEQRLLCDISDQLADEEDEGLDKVIEQLEAKAQTMTDQLTAATKRVEDTIKNAMCLGDTDRGRKLKALVGEMDKFTLDLLPSESRFESGSKEILHPPSGAPLSVLAGNNISGAGEGTEADAALEYALALGSLHLVLKPCLRPIVEKISSHNSTLLEEVLGKLPCLRRQDHDDKSKVLNEQLSDPVTVHVDIAQWSDAIDQIQKVARTYDLRSCIPHSVEGNLVALREFTRELTDALKRCSELFEDALSRRVMY